MGNIIYAIMFRIIKFINRLSVNTIKLMGFITNLIFLFLLMILVGLFCGDRFLAHSYYSGIIINELIATKNMDSFFKFSKMLENRTFLAIGIFFLVILLMIWFKIAIKKLWTTKNRKYNIFSNIAYVVINLFANVFIFVVTCLFIHNVILTGYVNSYKMEGVYMFSEKVDFINDAIRQDRHMAKIAINKIIYDLEDDDNYLEKLSFQERISFCKEVNHLMDLRNGPSTKEEHYLRNKLNIEPKNLEEILKEITSGNEKYGWHLLPPEKSALHMYGKDGEYNLKFISENGFFEAVYNKRGELITKETDPKNMGTYNYACPIKDAEKHAIYDVAPYYIWGNTYADKPMINSDVLYNIEKFNDNKDALKRYEEIKDIIESVKSLYSAA